MNRFLIIGNSGSGKTWLSKQLQDLFKYDVIHFDEIFWEQGGFSKKRDRQTVYNEIVELSQSQCWIMEGVFGDLAQKAIPKATTLIFLNMPWEKCEAALLERGSEHYKYPCSKEEAEKSFLDLLAWAKEYYARDNSCSLKQHKKLFNNFNGTKYEVLKRESMNELITKLFPH